MRKLLKHGISDRLKTIPVTDPSYTDSLWHEYCHNEMEPVSAILAVAEAFKEVYLLANFVYKTARSASHYQEEEKSLIAEFELELLHFRSFWAVFTRTDGNLIDDDALNQVSRYFGTQVVP